MVALMTVMAINERGIVQYSKDGQCLCVYDMTYLEVRDLKKMNKKLGNNYHIDNVGLHRNINTTSKTIYNFSEC